MSDGSDVVEAMVEEDGGHWLPSGHFQDREEYFRRVLRAALEAANPGEHDFPMIPIGNPSNRVDIVWNRLIAATSLGEPTDE